MLIVGKLYKNLYKTPYYEYSFWKDEGSYINNLECNNIFVVLDFKQIEEFALDGKFIPGFDIKILLKNKICYLSCPAEDLEMIT